MHTHPMSKIKISGGGLAYLNDAGTLKIFKINISGFRRVVIYDPSGDLARNI